MVSPKASVSTRVVHLLCSLLLLYFYPLLIALLAPLQIHRYVAKRLGKRDPSLGEMLSGLDAVLAAKGIYSQSANTTCGVAEVTSTVELAQVVKVVKKVLIDSEVPPLPELKQRIVTRHGYFFRQNVENFRVEDHVRYLNQRHPFDLVRKEELAELVFGLIALPFSPDQSPWEFVLIPNYRDDRDPSIKSVVFLRMHHCMGDGFASSDVYKAMGIKFAWKPRFNGNPIGLLSKLAVALTAPYHLLQKVFHPAPLLPGGLPPPSSGKTRRITQETEQIPMAIIKQIKKRLQVSYSAVILGCMAQAAVRLLRRKNIYTSELSVMMPWPVPGRPTELTNHFVPVQMSFPVESDIFATIQNINKKYDELKTSTRPLVLWYLIKLLGSLPVPLIPKKSEGLSSATCLLSNFPGPDHPIDAFGYELKRASVRAQVPSGCVLACMNVSYNGSFYFRAGCSTSELITQSDADYMVELFKSGVQQLQQRLGFEKYSF